MTIADKVEVAYYNEIIEARENGVSGYAVSGYAYAAAKGLAQQEGGVAKYLDSSYDGDYPTVFYTFADGSRCYLSYGSCDAI